MGCGPESGAAYRFKLNALCTNDGACVCIEGADGQLCDERPSCGDGVVQAVEQCDDGNAEDGDGCSSECTLVDGWRCNNDEPNHCQVIPLRAAQGGCPNIDLVAVGEFELARTTVTVAQYRQCVNAGVCEAPFCDANTFVEGFNRCNWVGDREAHPVNYVDDSRMAAFAAWVGLRLPTRAEFIFAATNRGQNVRYPWGSEPDCNHAEVTVMVPVTELVPVRCVAIPLDIRWTVYAIWLEMFGKRLRRASSVGVLRIEAIICRLAPPGVEGP